MDETDEAEVTMRWKELPRALTYFIVPMGLGQIVALLLNLAASFTDLNRS